jgi:ABC-type lipoprotein export system ATPase subunit
MSGAGLMCRDLIFSRPGSGMVLDRVDATFECGRPTLVLGPTGSGKSTLLHLLGAMLRPTSGEVRADGQAISRWTEPFRDVWRRQVGMVFQHLHLLPDLTVLENVLLPFIPRGSDVSELIHDAQELLERMDLAAARDVPLHTLSGGQRQRVALIRALLGRPRFILFDEPTSFQDDGQSAVLMGLLSESAAQGACIVVCSHDIRLRHDKQGFYRTYRLHRGRLEEPGA